jgi:hypothetical protein
MYSTKQEGGWALQIYILNIQLHNFSQRVEELFDMVPHRAMLTGQGGGQPTPWIFRVRVIEICVHKPEMVLESQNQDCERAGKGCLKVSRSLALFLYWRLKQIVIYPLIMARSGKRSTSGRINTFRLRQYPRVQERPLERDWGFYRMLDHYSLAKILVRSHEDWWNTGPDEIGEHDIVA